MCLVFGSRVWFRLGLFELLVSLLVGSSFVLLDKVLRCLGIVVCVGVKCLVSGQLLCC